jgi:MFS family permease
VSLEGGLRDDGLTGCRYQSRAFLLLPMCANIGVIIGPMIGGLTSDPAGNYPSLFGGIAWLEKYPYSPPNIISAIFLASAACAIFFGLEEASLRTPSWETTC